jgi:transcriptional regulator with XRE-family HTH domain
MNGCDTMKNRITELRNELSMSTSELAKILNISSRSIQKYERGDITPPSDKLSMLADLFNCSVDYLLYLTDKKTESNTKTNTENILNSNTAKVFSDRLKDIMIDKDITKEHLSSAIKIDKKQLESYLLGTQFPDVDILKNIASKLEISIDYLVGLSDNKVSNEIIITSKFIEFKIGDSIKKIPLDYLKDYLDLKSE